MSNHCHSSLSFHYNGNDLNRIEQIHQQIKGDDRVIDFNKIIPLPDLATNVSDDWYSKNWGCSWNCEDSTMTKKDATGLDMYFEANWYPPLFIVIKLIEMFPDVEIFFSSTEEINHYTHRISRRDGIVTVERGANLARRDIDGEVYCKYSFPDTGDMRKPLLDPEANGCKVDVYLHLWDVKENCSTFRLASWPTIALNPI